MKTLTIEEISALINGEIVGSADQKISGLETIDKAGKTDITFIGSKKYASKWQDSDAVIAIINKDIDLVPGADRALIRVNNADLAMAELLDAFAADTPEFEEDIHPSAVIHTTVVLGNDCRIGAGCYIGKNVVLGNNVIDGCTKILKELNLLLRI